MKLLFELKVHLQWVSKDSTGPKTVPCGTPDTKIVQMARFESISPIKIGLNVTEYESTLTHGNRAECETIHFQNMCP